MKPTVLTLMCLAVSCGGERQEPNPSGIFLAFASSFEGYRSWESTEVDGEAEGSTHLSGHRVIHLNKRSPRGSTTYEVGTIIVKEFTDVPLKERQVFAMVKRGGDYNATGALDWEWYELENLTENTVSVVWHGVGPPKGEQYGGDPNGGCNGCHAGAAAQDYVHAFEVGE